ncbi:hypothetical protein Tco_0305138 [Tanacetum coccineum]
MSSDAKLMKDEECELVDSTKYRGMIGSLLYLTASRPDIMFNVCLCACFQEDPQTSHFEAVKRIFRNIKGTMHFGLRYPKRTGIETIVYADSDHAGDYVDQKSTSDYCSDNQYAVSIKEDTAYLCLHSPKTTKETRSNTPYQEEGNTPYSSYMEIKYSGRYQTWSLLQETPDTLSLDPFFGDYIELNDLNVPLELRRDQVDDLIPTIEEGEVVEEFRPRNDARMVSKVFGYPSNYDHDKKIHIDCAYNLKFSCMTDFAILEDRLGDVIFGEPFLREVRINANRFEGMITIHNGNEEVSEEDKMNGISHSYQKLKSFYMGVLNLGPKYVRDAEMEEWLTRGHISMHEMG